MADQEAVFAHIQANITAVLLAASNPIDKKYQDAIAQYQDWENNQFPMWMTALAFELADESKDPKSRELAGILLRGALSTKEEERKQMVLQRWQNIPLLARNEVKNKLLGTMQSANPLYRHRAAEAVGAIAILDIPTDSWKGIIKLLTGALTAADTSDLLKEASLMALSEICIGTDARHLEPHSFDILFAVITGMSAPHKELQLVATKALTNAISFSSKNFSDPEQRSSIMKLVLQTTANPDAEVRLAVYECLVQIATAYYEFLPEHMNEGLFEASLNAIKSDPNDDVVQQAIEFWSTICDEEIAIFKENESAQETGAEPIPCHNFIKGAISHLAEPLFLSLSRGEADPELETWTIASAASSCISLIAGTLGDDVVPIFVDYISNCINDTNERTREAAILCFGSIMEGPSTAAIGAIIAEALPVLFERLTDESQLVKHTTAWCMSRIAEFHPAALGTLLEPFLNALCVALNEVPSIAAACADAIDFLASHITDELRDSSPLNPYLSVLFEALINAADRSDSDDASLRVNCYAAVRSLVKATPDESVGLIEHIVKMFAPRLKDSLAGGSIELQGEITGILTACSRRLSYHIAPVAQELMELYIELLKARPGVSEIYQEVFMAVGALASSIGPSFTEYLPAFGDYLLIGLNQWTDVDLCNHSIQLIGILALSLGDAFAPYCEAIIKIFLGHLEQPELDPTLGPTIIITFGDLAFALGSDFAEYMARIMDMLQKYQDKACLKTEAMSVWEDIELTNSWRNALVTVYDLIIQECGEKHNATLRSYLSSILKLISFIADDRRRDDSVNRLVCGLLCDIATHFPNSATTLKKFDPFLQYCLNSQSSEPETIDAASLTLEKFATL